eukprot:Sdes_comp9789_c0_seq2m1320
MEEVVLISSQKKKENYIHSLSTGNCLKCYKENNSFKNGVVPLSIHRTNCRFPNHATSTFSSNQGNPNSHSSFCGGINFLSMTDDHLKSCARDGPENYFLSSQTDKPSIFVYKYNREQPAFKFSVPEKLSSLVASLCGVYTYGGSITGFIYVWKTNSGELLAKFRAHYKAVSKLCLSEDDFLLFSGGDDGVVHVWSVLSILDAFSETILEKSLQSAGIQSLQTWTDHSLPITSMCCGYGGTSCRVLTASQDRTVRLYDMSSGGLIASRIFESAVEAVVLDNSETRFWVGLANGNIFEISLHSFVNKSAGSTEVTVVSGNSHEGVVAYPKAHFEGVTCLALNLDGSVLVSGGRDGNVYSWDVYSAQILQKIKSAEIYQERDDGIAVVDCITSLRVIPYPIGLYSQNSSMSNKSFNDSLALGNEIASCVGIIQPFKRHYSASTSVDTSVCVTLCQGNGYE